MSAEQAIRDGHLEQALQLLQAEIRKQPAEAKLRTFLFQLLVVLGQWERALAQLTVAGELDAANLAMVQTYREAIACEVLRKGVFQGQKSPLIFGEPTQWIALLLQALKLNAESLDKQAEELRAQAFDLAPTTTGTLTMSRFSG